MTLLRTISSLLIFWLITIWTSSVNAENPLDYQTFLDLPYTTAKLDQTTDLLQTLDIYRPQGDEPVPVILYVHGGGWALGDKKDVNVKPNFFTFQGFAFVSINYRLRWDFKVYDQMVDLVSAVGWIQENGHQYGLDTTRIVLMGHGAGGHLVSLLTTDPSYLKAEGMTTENIKAVVSIDSSSYDIPRLMRELGSFLERRKHRLIFSDNESVWKAASPITHVTSSVALPAFALLYNPEREDARLQAKGFARTLSESNVQVVMIPGSKDDSSRTDELVGTRDNIATLALMAFIRSQI